MKLKQKVSIVLPNWNGEELLKANLPHVIAASNGAEIIVADDASTDDSRRVVSAYPGVIFIKGKDRHGFSGNVNRGVSRATGEFIVLLNTDVRPQKDFLSPLLSHFSDNTVAAVGCLEKSHEPDGVVSRGRGRAVWHKGFFVHSRGEVHASDTAWVSGGSGAFRKSVWDTIGGMDTLFNPFYWEDIDLSYQIQKSGWTVIFEPKSIVEHYHEKGKIKTEYTKESVKRIVYRNQFFFHWKNISDTNLMISHMFWLTVRIFQAIVSFDRTMLVGFFMAVVRLPEVLTRRKHARVHWKKTDLSLFPSI